MVELNNIKVSIQEKNEIKKDSPDTLPLNPTAQGFSGAEIRRRLSKSITGEEGSVLSLLVDKMNIISDLFYIILDENDDESIIEQIKKLDAGGLETEIVNIKNGTTIVNKAEQDASGNVITSTYETKADVTSKLATKVDKTTKVIGIDLQDDISLNEFKTALGNATQSVAGLLSAEDKTHLDGLVALLESSDGNTVVDTIGEILEIFNNYPEGADLVTALSGKVDKEAGKGLSTEDYTTNEKNKLAELTAGLTVETWNTTTKTLALSDANKLFVCSSEGNKTLTIPPHDSVPLPIGTMITFLLNSPDKITFVGASGVTLTSMDSLLELATPFGMASLVKIFENTWQLVGALE